jgi:hypothetical protein
MPTDFKNRSQLDAWLGKQPPDVAVVLAARAALRVLPVAQTAKHEGFTGVLVLPVFRAMVFSWASAQYPAQRTELAAATADAYATVVAARAAAAAARAVAVRAAAAYAGARSYASAHAGDAAAPFFWSALSSDATRFEKGATASAIARSPLWRQGQPEQLHSLWREMKTALHAANQDWQVWTIWYDDRLKGRVRDKTRELAYVRIEEALWDQGPAVVNAEIERRIAMSSCDDGLRGRTTDLKPELTSERIEEDRHVRTS